MMMHSKHLEQRQQIRFQRYLTQFKEESILSSTPLEVFFFSSKTAVPFETRLSYERAPIPIGQKWGDAWENAWFHLKSKQRIQGQNLHIRFCSGSESMLFGEDGCPLLGMTNGSVFGPITKQMIPVNQEVLSKEGSIDCWIEAVAHGRIGINRKPEKARTTDSDRLGDYHAVLNYAHLVELSLEHWHLALEFEVLWQLANGLSEKSIRKAKIFKTLETAIQAYIKNGHNVSLARNILQESLEKRANDSDLYATSVGHAHIDTAWLWPVRESVRKCGRTFATQIQLLDRYPEYIFGASQAQHFKFVKQHYPKLYEKIKKKVKEGRIECQGGMWVEADCNLISGESMIRQFLYGKNFFMDEFGVNVENLWIPDVFGYSAALPQIMLHCGAKYILTQKMSWNECNRFPHHTFRWVGVDGSEVLAHFPPEDSYASQLNADSLVHAQERFVEKTDVDEFLVLFGIGDGGGGPKDEFIERGRLLNDLEGAPKVRFGRAYEYFERLSKSSKHLKVWQGELYLELHRGTLTTHALVKKQNRVLENKLRAIEMLCMSSLGSAYPQEQLDECWELLLINQFHDILPGSSIQMVYENTHQEYQKIHQICDDLFEDLLRPWVDGSDDKVTYFNVLGSAFRGYVSSPDGWFDEPRKVYVELPALQAHVLHKGDFIFEEFHQYTGILENEIIRYTFNNKGQLISIFDKEVQRELLEGEKPANVFKIYEDKPYSWDAWDVDLFYRAMDLHEEQKVKMGEVYCHQFGCGVRVEIELSNSKITQNVFLGHLTKELLFETTIDWHETQKMLRVQFPLHLMQAKAHFDIQYAYVEREMHSNTSWDETKFEVVAHKYVDVSNKQYGLAVLNDCKYGVHVKNNLIDLNLLRSSIDPDPDADIGHHRFSYSLYPHRKEFAASDVIAKAMQMNRKPLVKRGHFKEANFDYPFQLNSAQVSIEACKKSQNCDDLILRLVELKGDDAEVKIVIKDGYQISVTDGMEWKKSEPLLLTNGEAKLVFVPFEIKSIRISKD